MFLRRVYKVFEVINRLDYVRRLETLAGTHRHRFQEPLRGASAGVNLLKVVVVEGEDQAPPGLWSRTPIQPAVGSSTQSVP